jgi:hypothetical protein
MTPFERWALWSTSALTALSGLGYFWTKYLLATDDPWAVVNHPLEPWFLRVHVIVAPLLVFAVGLIALRHVWKHFRNGIRRGRRSGIATALLVGPMVVTGYLIQVITGQSLLRGLAISHIVFGCLYVVGLLIHQAALSRRRKPGRSAEASGPRKRRRRHERQAA